MTTRRKKNRTSATESAQAPRERDDHALDYARRHLRFGWWMVLLFIVLGAVLETLHGFKVGWYLDVSSETRRLMWTLAHAHGTLLGILNIAFAATVWLVPQWKSGSRWWASSCLMAAAVLIPAGFFLGGLFIYAGDPGLGVLIVPLGALLLCLAALLAACNAGYWVERQSTGDD